MEVGWDWCNLMLVSLKLFFLSCFPEIKERKIIINIIKFNVLIKLI